MNTRPIKFLSASAAARALNVALPTLLRRVAQGLIVPDGLAGTTILISADKLESIRESFHKPETCS